MKSIRKKIILLAFLSSFVPSFAYEINEHRAETNSDFTTRIGFDIKRKIYKGFSLTFSEEARFKTNSSKFDRLYSILSFDYKVNNYFKTGIGYTYMLINNGNKEFNHRHRINLDLVASYSVNQWNFSLRERPELFVRMGEVNPLKVANPTIDLRSRIMVEYSIRNKPLKPRLAFEIFNTLNAPKFAKGNYITRYRTEVGLKWEMVDYHVLNIYYRFDIDNARDISIDYVANNIDCVDLTYKRSYKHILGIAYTFDWK